MKNIVFYNKYKDKYLELLEQFSNYLITYKLETMEDFPQKSNIIIFDDRDTLFSNYSRRVLKELLLKKTKNVFSVRRTTSRIMPWEVSEPINFIST